MEAATPGATVEPDTVRETRLRAPAPTLTTYLALSLTTFSGGSLEILVIFFTCDFDAGGLTLAVLLEILAVIFRSDTIPTSLFARVGTGVRAGTAAIPYFK